MTRKERFDSLMALADFRRNVRDIRNALEWKVSLSIWAFLAAVAVAGRGYPVIWLGVLIGMAILLHGFWMFRNYLVQRSDALKMWILADQAAAILDGGDLASNVHFQDPGAEPQISPPCRWFEQARTPDEVRWWHAVLHPPCIFQLLVTACFAAIILLSSAYAEKKDAPVPISVQLILNN